MSDDITFLDPDDPDVPITATVTIASMLLPDDRVVVEWLSSGLDYAEVEDMLEHTLDAVRRQRAHEETIAEDEEEHY